MAPRVGMAIDVTHMTTGPTVVAAGTIATHSRAVSRAAIGSRSVPETVVASPTDHGTIADTAGGTISTAAASDTMNRMGTTIPANAGIEITIRFVAWVLVYYIQHTMSLYFSLQPGKDRLTSASCSRTKWVRRFDLCDWTSISLIVGRLR